MTLPYFPTNRFSKISVRLKYWDKIPDKGLKGSWVLSQKMQPEGLFGNLAGVGRVLATIPNLFLKIRKNLVV